MSQNSATALAHPNIAFIKYWGNQNEALRIPVNGSISMNLETLHALTSVTFDALQEQDVFILNGSPQEGAPVARVSRFMDRIREMAGISEHAVIVSENNFPAGAGIASSAAAFSALALAGSAAAGLTLDETGLTRLARLGSGSASRSIPSGFVEWLPGQDHASSYAVSIAGPDHWNLVDCIAVVSSGHKPVGSTEGHALAGSSPFQANRVADAPRRLEVCRKAILERDFAAFAEVVEQDSTMMHAVMMTSTPPLFYWEPGTIEIIKKIAAWRREGLNVCATLDAGPNVHAICTAQHASAVKERLEQLAFIEDIKVAPPGGPARLVQQS